LWKLRKKVYNALHYMYNALCYVQNALHYVQNALRYIEFSAVRMIFVWGAIRFVVQYRRVCCAEPLCF
jgi:hypothetical protein